MELYSGRLLCSYKLLFDGMDYSIMKVISMRVKQVSMAGLPMVVGCPY